MSSRRAISRRPQPATATAQTSIGTKTLIHLYIHPKISILPGNNKLPGRNRVGRFAPEITGKGYFSTKNKYYYGLRLNLVGVLVTLELLLRTIGKLAIAFIFLIFDYWFKLLNIQEI